MRKVNRRKLGLSRYTRQMKVNYAGLGKMVTFYVLYALKEDCLQWES